MVSAPPHRIVRANRKFLMRSLFLLPILFFAISAVADAGVTLRDQGDKVILDNGIVSVEVAKASGNVLGLKYANRSILSEPAYLDWHTGTNHHIDHGEFSVRADPKKNRGKMVEVVIRRKWNGQAEGAYDVELHHVLRQGESGFYSFAVFNHPAEYPATGIGQSRMVFRLNPDVFDFINVDDPRRRLMPPPDTPAEILGPKESSRFTSGPFKGFVTDKYHFFAEAGGHFVYGWLGTKSKIGCWIVKGSNEDHNGGPTKQRNTVHFPRMLLYILTCGHYGAAPVSIPAGKRWEKVFGPWMVYLNKGGDSDALWADAKRKAAAERQAWPFDWVSIPAYPSAAGRGTVTGQLRLSDPQDASVSSAGAWVGLAAPAPDWQQQSIGYQFWDRIGSGGKFTIRNVRPGDYTLFAFGDGVFDEFRRDGVKIKAGQSLDLGEIDWQATRRGRTLWQIGIPDRTAREFRHGDDHRQWGLWLKYPGEFPGDVNFVIGRSQERTDWNFSQMTVPRDGKYVGTTWTIVFDVPAPVPAGTAVLRFAFAGAQNAALRVSLNGEEVGDSGMFGADNAMARAGIHGQYSRWDLEFDAARLKPGRNEIALEQRKGGSPWKNVIYDCIRLEIPE